LKSIKPKEWGGIGLSEVFILTQVWLDLRLPEYIAEITTLVKGREVPFSLS
jgi:ATP-binding cassette subfamily B protein